MPRSLTAETFSELHGPNGALLFLALLISGDLAFVMLHLINILSPNVENPLLDLQRDKGYAEMYQYLKFLWVIVTLMFIALKQASWGYVSWILVFFYLLLDDALQLHERMGDHLGPLLGVTPGFGLRLEDLGELMASAMVGSVLLVGLLWSYKTGPARFRKTSRDLLLLMLLLVFFGVAVDMLHMMVRHNWFAGPMFGIIEDGGEMLSVSLMLWYTLWVLMAGADADLQLASRARKILSRSR